jgi:protein phosphatase
MIQPATEPQISPLSAPAAEPLELFTVRSFGLTDRGRVRPANEDHFAVLELARVMYVEQTSVPESAARYGSPRGHLFLVADGMGGHQAGEVASALSVATIDAYLLQSLHRFFNLQATEEHGVMREFQAALQQADARLFEEAERHRELEGMGTTLTLAFAVDWKLFVAHAGDSRCYHFSDGELRQLTHDHTVVADLVRRGTLSPQEASRHPFRRMVTNVLGGNEPGVRVELHRLALEPGDVMLLCSDGLTEMLPDADIAAVLADEPDPQRACERLVALANDRGGKDNITVVVARFEAA